MDVGNLKVNTKYRVSVGAYGWAGEGRPSMPRDISTASHGKSMWVGIHFGSIISTTVLLISFTHFSFCLCHQICACLHRPPLSLLSWLCRTQSWHCHGSKERVRGAHLCFTSWWLTSGQSQLIDQLHVYWTGLFFPDLTSTVSLPIHTFTGIYIWTHTQLRHI